MANYQHRKGSPNCSTKEGKKRYNRWYYRNVTCKGR